MIKVSLCKGCIEMLKEYYPYIDNELEITEVTTTTACDNHENNMGKENRKINSKKVKRVFKYKKELQK